MSAAGIAETANSILEPSSTESPGITEDPEETPEKFGLNVNYDFVSSDYLEDGGVAATAKVPEYERIKDFEDFVKYDDIRLNGGELYGRTDESNIGFIANREIYEDLDPEVREHVNLHEAQHFIQYDDEQLWGDALDEEYNLCKNLTEQLNRIDQLMDLSEDPIYSQMVNDAELTALVEGYTERVTQAMQDDGQKLGRDFYPGYTQVADHLMKQKGIDPEEEFS